MRDLDDIVISIRKFFKHYTAINYGEKWTWGPITEEFYTKYCEIFLTGKEWLQLLESYKQYKYNFNEETTIIVTGDVHI